MISPRKNTTRLAYVSRLAVCLAIVLGFSFTLSGPLLAAATSQGYRSAAPLVAGTVVSEASPGVVEPSNSVKDAVLTGVVINDETATIDFGKQSDSVQVATSGTAEMFVTDLGGVVKTGDMVGASPINGVGMKAKEGVKIVGVVRGPPSTTDVKTVSVKDDTGKTTEAKVSLVSITVQSGTYSLSDGVQKSPVPQSLQLFANSVAGKPVAVLRVLIAATVMLIALLVVGVMVFAAVRATVISLGRNPLARYSIFRALIQVALTAFTILLVGLVGTYLILTR